MIAGVLLGPSLFGLRGAGHPDVLFPPEIKGVLYVVAQFGVGLYMFLVGLGFRSDHFKANAHKAAAVSIAGIVVPFVVAIVADALAHDRARDCSPPTCYALRRHAVPGRGHRASRRFPCSRASSTSAGSSGTALGTLSLSAGAIDDAVAWCVLAVVLASFGARAPASPYIAIVGGIALFALCMIFVVPRLLAPLGALAEREHAAGQAARARTIFAIVADAVHVVARSPPMSSACTRCSAASCSAP